MPSAFTKQIWEYDVKKYIHNLTASSSTCEWNISLLRHLNLLTFKHTFNLGFRVLAVLNDDGVAMSRQSLQLPSSGRMSVEVELESVTDAEEP
jgi:hypothetical protein